MSPSAAGETARQTQQFGQAAQNLTGTLADIKIKQQERENADRVLRAETALKQAETAFHTSITERRGQNAWSVTNEAAKWWDESARKYGEALDNDVQRLAFDRMVAERRNASLDFAARHESAQRRQSLADAAKASIQGSRDAAAAAPHDPQIIEQNRQQVERNVRAMANLEGWAPEAVQVALGEELTAFHKGVIGALVDKQPLAARDYYNTNKDQIDGTERAAIEKLLSVGGAKALAETFADEITRKGLTEAQALELARERFGPDDPARAHAVDAVKERYTERTVARERAQRDAADQAWKIYASTGSLRRIPASVLDALDGRDLAALRKQAKADADGIDIKTNWSTYAELREYARENPEGFAKLDLRRYFGQLGRGEREGLMDIKDRIAKGEGLQVSSLSQQIDAAFGSNDKEEKGKFAAAVYAEINAEQKRTGKNLSWEDRQKIIDRMMVEGEVASGKWYAPDRNTRLYEIRGTEDARRFTPTIPRPERDKIEAALRRAGRPVSDAEVARLYKRKHGIQ